MRSWLRSARVLLLVALAGLSGRLEAQEGAAVAVRATPAVTVADTSGELSSWSVGQCMGGLGYGAPQKLAVSYGGGLRYEPTHGGPDVNLCTFAVGKLGLGGARVALAQGVSFGSIGSGVIVSGGLLRTFGAPTSGASRMRTYGGVSVHVLTILAFGFEVGWYRRLGDTASESTDARHVDQKKMIVWSVGFGY